jgi:CRP/FNR family transcriptional regulator
VRVARGSPGGRTLELYRVAPGELCVVSTSCLFGQSALVAHGHTVEATELVLLSPAGFCALDGSTNPSAAIVFGIFADRMADLMALAEAVAFQRLDQRLASTLLGHGAVLRHAPGPGRRTGHGARDRHPPAQALRAPGWVRLGRERIDVLDSTALRSLAAGTLALPAA